MTDHTTAESGVSQATVGLAVFTGARATQVAGAVQSGQTGRLIAHPPARTGHAVAILTRTAFNPGLNQILLRQRMIGGRPWG